MDYGVQIFGCLREFREDPEAFFHRISEMGYRQIEPCVLFGDTSGVPEAFRELLWSPAEVPAFQKQMTELGLTLSSCHVFCPDPLGAADELLALAEKTSIDTYVINCPGDTIAEKYPAFAQTCRALSERLAGGGVSLWLHNGGPEIAARATVDGEEVTVLEAVLSLAGDRLGVQIDTGWVMSGGVDPAAFLKKLGTRVRSVHFKDMAEHFETLAGNDRFAVLGKGVTDIPGVLAQIPAGVPILVDQDATQDDFFTDLRDSINALRRVRP